jgi:hypothetical protein
LCCGVALATNFSSPSTVSTSETATGANPHLGQAYFQFKDDGKHYLADASGKKLLDLHKIEFIEQLIDENCREKKDIYGEN